MKRIISVIFLIISSAIPGLRAQTESDTVDRPFHAEIYLIGKSYGDSIVLRWGPTTPGAWSYLNNTGYIIERNSFQSEDDFDPAGYRKLTPEPIKPLPLEEWESVVKRGSDTELSAIAAQALYGETFSSSGTTLFDAADEFMNRYSFSMLSADLSPVTAHALGLRFSDNEVETQWYYMYRVYPAVPGANYTIDTAYFVIQNVQGDPVPAPVIDQAFEGEGVIKISWEKAIHEPVFSAYIIERSEDNINYHSLTNIPYINPESDRIGSVSSVFQYEDSIPENYKPYYYRLSGITPFGEWSAASEPVRAMGRDRTPPPAPANVDARSVGEGKIRITWETPQRVADLDGFYIGRGDNLDENFQPIHSQKIPPDSTAFTDMNSDPLGGNYYVVAAVDTAGNGSISMVSYAAILDSIPPSAPVGLKGSVDTSGIVTLTWTLGDEIDLAGYMIYFSNSSEHVFSTVNEAPLADTIYIDTIQIRTLTRHVYYRIKAVDTRWNYSEYSAILELTRPDLIPPTTPVFSNYKLSLEGLWLEWIPSSSNDVAGYELEVRKGDEQIRRVFVEKREDLKRFTYTYPDVEAGSLYTVTVSAIDEAGLRSVPSNPIQVNGIDLEQKLGIENLAVERDRDGRSLSLTWTFGKSDQISRFILYRSVGENSLVTYKSLEPSDHSFSDHMVRKGQTYGYSIKAIYKSGRQSPFSNVVTAVID